MARKRMYVKETEATMKTMLCENQEIENEIVEVIVWRPAK
jgi:hypothetical protein